MNGFSLGSVILGLNKGPISAVMTQDGKFAFVANQNPPEVMKINAKTNAIVSTFPLGASPRFMAITPKGDKLFVGTQMNLIYVINTKGGITGTISVNSPFGMVTSPDGKFLYVCSQSEDIGGVFRYKTKNNAQDAFMALPNATGIAVSVDGKKVFATGALFGVIKMNAKLKTTSAFSLPGGLYGIGIDADAKKFYVSDTNLDTFQTTIASFKAGNASAIGSFPIDSQAYSVTPGEGNKFLYFPFDGKIAKVKTKNGNTTILPFTGGTGFQVGVSFNKKILAVPQSFTGTQVDVLILMGA